MKKNQIKIKIKKPIRQVYQFCITPPNSSLWIPGIISEETSHWPIQIGTVYKLKDNQGNISKMTVVNFKKNKMIKWISENKNYHCKYILKSINENTTELTYFEWVNKNKIEGPFSHKILKKLKSVIENSKN